MPARTLAEFIESILDGSASRNALAPIFCQVLLSKPRAQDGQNKPTGGLPLELWNLFSKALDDLADPQSAYARAAVEQLNLVELEAEPDREATIVTSRLLLACLPPNEFPELFSVCQLKLATDLCSPRRTGTQADLSEGARLLESLLEFFESDEAQKGMIHYNLISVYRRDLWDDWEDVTFRLQRTAHHARECLRLARSGITPPNPFYVLQSLAYASEASDRGDSSLNKEIVEGINVVLSLKGKSRLSGEDRQKLLALRRTLT